MTTKKKTKKKRVANFPIPENVHIHLHGAVQSMSIPGALACIFRGLGMAFSMMDDQISKPQQMPFPFPFNPEDLFRPPAPPGPTPSGPTPDPGKGGALRSERTRKRPDKPAGTATNPAD